MVEATLAQVAAGNVDVCAPAVFVIGEVVHFRHRRARATKITQLEEAIAK